MPPVSRHRQCRTSPSLSLCNPLMAYCIACLKEELRFKMCYYKVRYGHAILMTVRGEIQFHFRKQDIMLMMSTVKKKKFQHSIANTSIIYSTEYRHTHHFLI